MRGNTFTPRGVFCRPHAAAPRYNGVRSYSIHSSYSPRCEMSYSLTLDPAHGEGRFEQRVRLLLRLGQWHKESQS